MNDQKQVLENNLRVHLYLWEKFRIPARTYVMIWNFMEFVSLENDRKNQFGGGVNFLKIIDFCKHKSPLFFNSGPVGQLT